ncbi:dicarboxylate/amino acid:cation symporter [Thermovenabulum gondwanense]|uniref:Proton glutamate symport protein n=1 Tax=Thermovenabulum gondwanense TaxID=520767 RepID=A0A161PW19_9FIRM|nr:dicarboxylate/amino acid:cation symporter [Thermovenabulum gondwanense]KYO67311.1 Proton glutamate symport protein [Thermovenabulum gondwanense]
MVEKQKRFLGWYFGTPLVWRILIALIIGAIVGLIVGPKIAVIEPLGTLMIKLLKMIILPLIFSAIVTGVGGMPASKIGRVAGKILLYYVSTTVFAATFGLLFSQIFKPGLGLSLSGTAAEGAAVQTPSVSSVLLNMVPDNVAASFANGAYLQVLVFAVIFGIAISFLRDAKDDTIREAVLTVYKFCQGTAELMFSITKGVLEYSPIGVFALISVLFAQEGTKVIGSVAKLVLTCYIGYAFQLLIVYGLLFTILAKLSYAKFIAKAKDAMLMAFATRSSSATLPLTLKVAEENLGVSRNIGSFTLPLGSQINLDGEAYYQIISVFFVAFAAGIHLTAIQKLIVILVVTIGTMGTAGIAGSGPVVLLAVMNMVGLNVEPGTVVAGAFALVLGIDVILDMGRTMCNVTGDMVGTCIVAKSEGMLDMEKWV